MHRLVRQRARARHDTDLTLLVDVPGHDADLALLGLDDTGAVRADQARLVLALHDVLHAQHVVLGNALRDTHDQGDLRSHGLQNGAGSAAGRHINDGGVSTRRLLRLHAHRPRQPATSATEAKIGRPKCVVPAFLGFTPPTILVPYSMACWVWKVPYAINARVSAPLRSCR